MADFGTFEQDGHTALTACCACGGGARGGGAATLETTAAPTSMTSGGPPGCLDEPEGWVDSDGDSCSEYATFSWCTTDGGAGEGFEGTVEDFRSFMHDGHTALTACCACGGGMHWVSAGRPLQERLRSASVLGSEAGCLQTGGRHNPRTRAPRSMHMHTGQVGELSWAPSVHTHTQIVAQPEPAVPPYEMVRGAMRGNGKTQASEKARTGSGGTSTLLHRRCSSVARRDPMHTSDLGSTGAVNLEPFFQYLLSQVNARSMRCAHSRTRRSSNSVSRCSRRSGSTRHRSRCVRRK